VEASTHVKRTTARDDYETPAHLFGQVHSFYQFDVDFAASAENAKLPNYYSEQRSFLSAPPLEVTGMRAWLNPPFMLKDQFLAHVVKLRNDFELAVCLVANNARETDWWREWVWPHADEIISLSPRVNFFLDGKEVRGVAFPTCLAVYRPRLAAKYGAPRETIWRWKDR